MEWNYTYYTLSEGERGVKTQGVRGPCEKINVFRIYSYLQLACKICTL